MDILMVFIIGIIILGILLFLFKGNKQYETKSSFQKKEEIIEDFKNQLHELLQQNSSVTSDELQHKKMAFIKDANRQLHNNIFFTDKEVRKIIEELAQM